MIRVSRRMRARLNTGLLSLMVILSSLDIGYAANPGGGNGFSSAGTGAEACERVLGEARRLAGENRIEEALVLLEEYQRHETDRDLVRKVEPMRVAYLARWREIFAGAVEEARRLAANDRIEEALLLVETLQATTRDPELPKSLEPMRIAFEARRGEVFEKKISEARAQAAEGRIDDALRIIDDLERTTVDPDFRNRLLPMRVAYLARRDEILEGEIKRARSLAQEGRIDEAIWVVEVLEASPAAGELVDTLRPMKIAYLARRKELFEANVRKARSLAAGGRIEEALALVEMLQEKAGDTEALKTLASMKIAYQARRSEIYENEIKHARALAGEERLGEALALVESLEKRVTDPDLLKSITPMVIAYRARKSELFDAGVKKARALAAEGQMEDAIKVIEELETTADESQITGTLRPLKAAYEARKDEVAKETRPVFKFIPRNQAVQPETGQTVAVSSTPVSGVSGPPSPVRPSRRGSPSSAPVSYPDEMWRDPVFRAQFVGSYAMVPDIEPKVNDDERQILMVVLNHMSDSRLDDALGLITKLYLPDPSPLEELGIQTVALQEWEAKVAEAEKEAAAKQATEEANTPRRGKTRKADRAVQNQDTEDRGEGPPTTLYGAVRDLIGNDDNEQEHKPSETARTSRPRRGFFRRISMLWGGGGDGEEAEADSSSDAGRDVTDGTDPSAAVTPAESTPEQPLVPPKPRTILESPSATFAYIAGNICFQKGDMEAATQWYRLAVKLFPSFMRAHKNLGMVLVRRGEGQAAIENLTRALELGAHDGLLYGLLAYAYTSAGNHLSAEVGYRNAILIQPDNTDWKLGLARSLLAQSRFAEAIALCGQLIVERPDDPMLWGLQAKAYLALDKPVKAAQSYEYLRVLGEADIQSLNSLGDIYVKTMAPDAAVDVYLEALAADSAQSPDPYILKAKLLAANGASDAAVKLLDAVKENSGKQMNDEEKKEMLRVCAWIALRKGDDESQAKLLEEIVQIDPGDGEALISLGEYYGRNGKPEQAVFYYERAEGIERVEAKAKIHHAQLLVRQSDYAAAIPLLKSALLLEPRDEVAAYLKQVEGAATSKR